MLTPSPEIIQLLSAFAPALTAPTLANVQVLLFGTLLATGRRTVSAALHVLGVETATGATGFGKYHRVLNRARWSPLVLSRILLGLIVSHWVPAGMPLVILVDETLERRRGHKIRYKGWFRDAVRSTGNLTTFALGIRWLCACVLVSVPWSSRPWALPFLAVPVLSEKTAKRLGKTHRGPVAWAQWIVERVRRWQSEREIVLVADGSYSAIELLATCQRLSAQGPTVQLVTGLRLDAGLYDFPAVPTNAKSGPKPKKGAPLPKLQERLADAKTPWRKRTVRWYGGQEKRLEIVSGVCLWYKRGCPPVPLRWVLVRCVDDPHFKPAAYLCSATSTEPEQILAYVIARWNIEVTFEEMRAHLGLETQRHWSQRAIERTTPCLFGLFSLVVLMARVLHPTAAELPVRQTGWYAKEEATFSDALAAVRRHLWSLPVWDGSPCLAKSATNKGTSWAEDEMCLIPRPLLHSLQNLAYYAT